MGDNLQSLTFRTGKTVKQITHGSGFGCAILNDDTVKCWGSGLTEDSVMEIRTQVNK